MSSKTETSDNKFRLNQANILIVQEVIQKFVQLASEHSVLRENFVRAREDFTKFEKTYRMKEKAFLENLTLARQEQQVTLKHIGCSMTIPEDYVLDSTTMTWIPKPSDV